MNKSGLGLELNLLSCYSRHLPLFIPGSHALRYSAGQCVFWGLLFSVSVWVDRTWLCKNLSHQCFVYKDTGMRFSNKENPSAANTSPKSPAAAVIHKLCKQTHFQAKFEDEISHTEQIANLSNFKQRPPKKIQSWQDFIRPVYKNEGI